MGASPDGIGQYNINLADSFGDAGAGTDWVAYGIALLVGVGIPAALMAATTTMTPNRRRRRARR